MLFSVWPRPEALVWIRRSDLVTEIAWWFGWLAAHPSAPLLSLDVFTQLGGGDWEGAF